MVKIKVLHLFTTLDAGGVESFLYNYYINIKEEIQFDFIVPGNSIGFYEKELSNYGSKIFHVPLLKKSPVSQISQIYKIMKSNNYDIIHCHGYKSFIGLIIGFLCGCKVRILHSHMVYVNESRYQILIRKFTMLIANLFLTEKFACGIDAAKFLFGKKEYEKGNVRVINNAVDIDKFKFNVLSRNTIRDEFKISNDTFLLGNIGRLTYQKNQEFLLDLAKIFKDNKSNIKTILIGEGEDYNNLLQAIEKECLHDYVLLVGKRKDIPEILSAIDLFILPSRFEGLPVVLAEVQAAGLKSLVANTITKEINVTDSIEYLSLKSGTDVWINRIYELKEESYDREKVALKMKDTKFDLKKQAVNLINIYYNLVKG